MSRALVTILPWLLPELRALMGSPLFLLPIRDRALQLTFQQGESGLHNHAAWEAGEEQGREPCCIICRRA